MGSSGLSAELEGSEYRVNLGYGGFWLGYAHQSWRLFHPYSSMKLGWGSVTFDPEPEFGRSQLNDNVFVVEPEIGVEVNLFKWFRLAGTGGYRFVTGADQYDGFKNGDLSCFFGKLTLRFGGFGKPGGKNQDVEFDE